MDRAVDRAVSRAEILLDRLFAIFRDMYSVRNKLADTLVLGRADRNDRHAQDLLHKVDIDRAAVAGQLIHHVQRDNDRPVRLKKLHRQIQVALDIRRVNDIDDRVRLVVQNKIPRHDLLFGIRRHRIDARQVRYDRIRVSDYRAVLTVDCYAREIAHMLVRARKPVEKRRLSAVLIAHQRERKYVIIRQRILMLLVMVNTRLA